MADWELVFSQSPVNGGDYREPESQHIEWPKGTWLQRRLEALRKKEKKDDQRST